LYAEFRISGLALIRYHYIENEGSLKRKTWIMSYIRAGEWLAEVNEYSFGSRSYVSFFSFFLFFYLF